MDAQTCEAITEGLRSHELTSRVDSFSKLKIIAEYIGPERTRTELLRYLLEFSDDEDVILLEIINQLSTFSSYLGGPQYLQFTFDIFETYMLHDDPQVRTRATEVFLSFFPQLDAIQIVRYLLPVIRHLVLSEWYLGRLSASILLPHIYPLCSKSLQNELCAIFSALALDEHPTVRKSICQQFGLFATLCLHDPKLARVLYHLVIHASKDIHDAVRMAAVDSCIVVCDVLRHYNAQYKALTVIFSLATDVSWRVRYIVARRYPLILASLDTATFTGDETAEYFAKLLVDHESEVRTAAAGVFGRVCCLLGPDKTARYLVPLLKTCAEDLHDPVRIAFSHDFLHACNTLPQFIVNETILPLFQQLLSDTRSEVKLNLMSSIHFIKPHVTEESFLKTLLPSIIELSQHTNWRIRVNVTMQYVILAHQLSPETFLNRLLPIALCQLCDPVASVRYGAISNFFKFTIVYGINWCRQHLLPRLQALAEHQSFTHRLSAALAITGLLQIFPLTVIYQEIYPIISNLLNDRVTNIQLLSLRSVALILSRLLQFTPHEHVWLQQDQLFSFSEMNPDPKSASEPIGGHSTLILQVLLHNIKQRAFWEQEQLMFPVSVGNSISLVPSNYVEPPPSPPTNPANPTDAPTMSGLPDPNMITPGPTPIKGENFTAPVLGQQSSLFNGNNNNIDTMKHLGGLKYVHNSRPEHQQPLQIPSLSTYIRQTKALFYKNSHNINFPYSSLFSTYHDSDNLLGNGYTGPDTQYDTFSDLVALLNSPDFDLDYQDPQLPVSLSDKNSDLVQPPVPLPPPIVTANDRAFNGYLQLNERDIVSTVQDPALSFRDYTKIINLFLKKNANNTQILTRVLNDASNYSYQRHEPEYPENVSQQVFQYQANCAAQTLPFHLLASILTPTPGASGTNIPAPGTQSSAQQQAPPKNGSELYVFLLLKRLREDYRRIARESINVVLQKLRDHNAIGINRRAAIDDPESDEGQAAQMFLEEEATLINELNYLKNIITAQHQQASRQEGYLFHITPVIYQLQQSKHVLMSALKIEDEKVRIEPIMMKFCSQLFDDLERFRVRKIRGGNELVVFANETLLLIQQLGQQVLDEEPKLSDSPSSNSK